MNNCIGDKMNKSELVDAIASGLSITKAEAIRFVDKYIEIVTDVLKDGGEIVLPRFGSFSTVNRSARSGRNPQTGEAIEIKASRVAKFKAGKSLREAVQEA